MIDSFEALKVISRYRNNAIVVTTMTTMFEWPKISANPDMDLPMTGAMGKASSVGLGLALAQPGRKVIVLDGDGSLLMNLGSLVTIANMAPSNLIHFVFENGLYRTSGGQPIPNVGKFSFTRLIKEAGYTNMYEFEELEDLENNMETILNQTGPTSVCLKVTPIKERSPFPIVETSGVILQFMESVQRTS
ncbi:thiamine pyrophosphate-dependent enzyme [Chloroflexota bacterium]